MKSKWLEIVALSSIVLSLLTACVPITPQPTASTVAEQSTASESASADSNVENPDAEANEGETTSEAAPAPAVIEIPQPKVGRFNVAFVYVGPIGDGGWTYAHDQGRLIVEKYLGKDVSTAYLESIPEGEIGEDVIRRLAEAGFNAIFTTSFGFMEGTANVAEEFPDTYFVHVSGFRKNKKNLANLFGSMEDMKYLAGMIAGARAKEDGSNRVGYVASFPIPEVIRYVNATAIGMRKSCPECVMDVRWTMSWFDPTGEANAATEMLDAGASVIVSGVDGTGPVQMASERGKWGIGYDSNNACEIAPDHCLTTTYWDWGQVYIWQIRKMLDGKFASTDLYFDSSSNGLGLLGFMLGQEPSPAIPEAVLNPIRTELDQMVRGSVGRFDIFAGPLRTNKGETLLNAGEQLSQSDLEGLSGINGRPDCVICMNWLVEGILPELDVPAFPG